MRHKAPKTCRKNGKEKMSEKLGCRDEREGGLRAELIGDRGPAQLFPLLAHMGAATLTGVCFIFSSFMPCRATSINKPPRP